MAKAKTVKIVSDGRTADAKLAAAEELARRFPKTVWAMAAGRSSKVLQDHAAAFGLPISGRYFDLRAVAKWLHDFLTAHGRKLKPGAGGTGAVDGAEADPLLADPSIDSPALERYRHQQAEIARLKRLEMERRLINAENLRELLERAADVFRRTADQAQRRFGPDAYDLFMEHLDEYEAIVRAWAAERAPALPGPEAQA